MSSARLKNSFTFGVNAAMREATCQRQETDTQTNVKKSFGQGLIPGSLQGITYIIQLNCELKLICYFL